MKFTINFSYFFISCKAANRFLECFSLVHITIQELYRNVGYLHFDNLCSLTISSSIISLLFVVLPKLCSLRFMSCVQAREQSWVRGTQGKRHCLIACPSSEGSRGKGRRDAVSRQVQGWQAHRFIGSLWWMSKWILCKQHRIERMRCSGLFMFILFWKLCV